MSYPIDIKDAVSDIVLENKLKLQQQLDTIDAQATTLLTGQWTPLSLFLTDEFPKFNGIKFAVGVYAIYHVNETSNELFYIGEGAICNRKTRHRAIFRNKGMPTNHYKGCKLTSSSDSIVGRKMYLTDPIPENWLFSYIKCEKYWARMIEHKLIEYYRPPANL